MKLLCVVKWAAAIAVGTLAWLSPAGAQAPPPLPVPDLGLVIAGTVSASARQPDGGLVIGGSFTLVDGQPRSNLARLKPDGTLDPNWHPQVSNTINAIAVNPTTGAVYIGGFITAVDGVTRNRVAKLDGATGTVDPNWDPSPNSTVNALVVDPVSGAVFVGGAFATIGTPALARVGMAKVDGGSGAIDPAWTPAASSFSSVNAMVLSGDGGALYVGGTFTTITGTGDAAATARKYLAKIDTASGALDASWDPAASASVSTLALDAATGDVYAGGNFTTIGVPAVARQRLAKIAGSGIGAVDATFSAAAGSSVYALALDAANHALYVGGSFTTMAGSGDPSTTARLRLGKLDAISGALDAAWNPAASGNVSTLAFGGANTLLAGGNFGTIGTTTRLSFAALAMSDGALGTSVDVGMRGSVATVGRQSDGGLIVGGNFLKAGGVPRTHLLRLAPDGSLDPDFKPLLSSNVSNVAIGADDSVYLTGFFFTIDGVSRPTIAKLSATGTLVDAWNTTLSGPASTMIENGGMLYLGGSFTTVNNVNHARLARVDAATGARDAAWMPAPTGPVNAIAIDAANGMLFAGGGFQAIGGATRAYLAKLELATGAATAWNPIVNSSVSTLVLRNGAVYAGGAFVTATVGGTTGVARQRLIKIDAATGDVDAAWNPGSSTNVTGLAADTNGALYVAAGSGTVGGQTRAYLSKIDASGNVNTLWNPSPNAQVNTLGFGANGEIYTGGTFTTIGGATRLAFAALPSGVSSTTTIDAIVPAATVAGESYDVAVSVTVPGGTASGTVAIDDGNGATCTATLANGAGSCALVSTAAGTRTITASHASTDYLPSWATASHVVNRAATTTAFGAGAPATAAYGATVAVPFALTVDAPGAGNPGGNVAITVDGNAGCSAAVADGTCTLPATLAAGAHTLIASYAGDANFGASTSVSHTLTIAKAVTTTTILDAAPAVATSGTPVTIGYAVGGAGNATGDVAVLASTGETCSATVAAAQCQITFATAGTRTLTASYTGDANHDASTSAPFAYEVGNAEVWVEGQKLTPSDGGNRFYFGIASAVRGDVALVGSKNATVNGNAQRGAVYVFRRVGGVWTQAQKLIAADGAEDTAFGASIALEGNTALIGAPGVTVSGAAAAGAVYVFTETDGTWTQAQKITAGDPYPAAEYGANLSLSGDRAIIGASNLNILGQAYQGAAYALVRSAQGTWSQVQKIVAADGEKFAYFGHSVSLDGSTVAIGAGGATIGGVLRQGAVYVYTESAGQWSLAQKLTASDGAQGNGFGWWVALSGSDLLVGVPSAPANGMSVAGKAYAFAATNGTWTERQKLTSPNAGAYYNFGYGVLLRGDTGFITEPYATVNGAASQGAVYSIRKHNGEWAATSRLTASDGLLNNWFGWSVGWDGETAVIGAMGVNYMPNANQGAVYFFRPDAIFGDGFE